MSNKIDAVAKAGGIAPNGKAYATLEYYMVHNPKQTAPRKIPGYVVADSAGEALSNAEAIANELDGLDLSDLSAACRKLYADNRMLRVL